MLLGLDVSIEFRAAFFGLLAPRAFGLPNPFLSPGNGARIAAIGGARGVRQAEKHQIVFRVVREKRLCGFV